MAKKPGKRGSQQPAAGIPRRWAEFLGVALFAIGALVLGGLVSHQFGDGTLMGPVGGIVASALYAGFGMASYLVVVGIFGVGIKSLRGVDMELRLGEGVGFTLATIGGCVLLHVLFPHYRVHAYTAGGLVGELVGEVSLGLFDVAGTYLIAGAIICVGLVASTPLSTRHLVELGRGCGHLLARSGRYLWHGIGELVATQREKAVARSAARAEDNSDGLDPAEFTDDPEHDPNATTLDADADEEEWEYEDEAEDGAVADEDGGEWSDEDEAEPAASPVSPEPVRGPSRGRGARAEPKATSELDPPTAGNPTARKPTKRKSTKGESTKGESTKGESTKGKSSKGSSRGDPPARAVKEPPPDGAPHDARAPGADRPEIVLSRQGDDAVVSANPSGKKPPPRASELAQAAGEGVAKAAARKPASEEAATPTSCHQRVEYLTDRYELPPLQLFEAQRQKESKLDRDFVYAQADKIVHTLAQFRIRGKVTKVHPGPVITRYEFKPEAGVKLSKIETLENDLAMALEAIRIRILAPIPGKATVGFEVPNKTREMVTIHEILDEEDLRAQPSGIHLSLGKDITGKPVAINLAKAPHLLVAGATGAGKSVGVNSMICSILYTCTPDEVRMILIDPKMLEFSIYADIPHLLLPVITDAERANNALRWTVNEMERRYAMLSEAKVRDIRGYNDKLPQLQSEWDAEKRALEQAHAAQTAIADVDGEASGDGSKMSGIAVDEQGNLSPVTGGVELGERPEGLAYIVVIIDEFADLMMVASKEVEANVARIAAKARAAGIHLIVATQRPSVDVITGTIKNNFPSRIAFQVTSDVDSRTILDQKGAKQLLGMGDMLYMDRGREPRRIHGCFVSEHEIEKVVAHTRKHARPAYDLSIARESDGGDAGEEEQRPVDELYDKAVQIVAEAQKVSTSMIQRRLGIGYNRAAKIVECMEQDGVIGPARGTKPREVYVSAA
ncbi:MAG: DNA translocase FtsK [Myxococcales bacterium FL481]|nr:MAG: DNA translocase FtsK [Myxococcales bacterium FL481]